MGEWEGGGAQKILMIIPAALKINNLILDSQGRNLQTLFDFLKNCRFFSFLSIPRYRHT